MSRKGANVLAFWLIFRALSKVHIWRPTSSDCNGLDMSNFLSWIRVLSWTERCINICDIAKLRVRGAPKIGKKTPPRHFSPSWRISQVHVPAIPEPNYICHWILPVLQHPCSSIGNCSELWNRLLSCRDMAGWIWPPAHIWHLGVMIRIWDLPITGCCD